ncbi:MAG TPA: hypothetical protein VKQ30_18280 [Ktedonobacterales bacterium]|nr:hypothetical protein [Ktedonobacterales bacterium]
MKLFFWRRKPQATADALAPTAAPAAPAPAPTVGVLERSQIPTRPLAMPIELRDAVLRFALDCLVASGARVRVEADDLISAVLPDGTSARYTTSLMRARAEDDTELLVQGGAALTRLLDECAARAAVTSLRLEAHADPLEIARAQLAAPIRSCDACAHTSAAELCQRCPLREDCVVLAGMPERATPRVARKWVSRGIELAYTVVSNDRHGRRDEEIRVAFDGVTGSRLPLLTPDLLADAQAQAQPEGAAAALDAALAHAERALMPQLQATGSLLRLLAEREYRARLDDIRTTSQRLLRESPDESPAIREALERELARLDEVYAVDVNARLTSICFVERPMATLSIPLREGAALELTADLAAGVLLTPTCAVCGVEARAASVCASGHLICSACGHHAGQQATTGCPVCAGLDVAIQAPRTAGESDVLSLEHLDAMSDTTWRLFVAWLLEQDGYNIESGGASGSLEHWMCRRGAGDGVLLAGAIRFADHRMLSREDVERLAAQLAIRPSGACLLISTAPAGPSAVEAARRLDVRLLDRAALTERLHGLVARHLHEREAATRTQEERAAAAATARASILAELQRAEAVFTSVGTARRAAGRSAVAAAAKAINDALMPAERALLAWETLASDFTAAFDEREARDGSLSIRADAATFEEMAGRARHLGAALTTALEIIAGTPAIGDLGYTVWRRDIWEQLSAHCEAYRWRVSAIDPSRWRIFAGAHDTQAYERAGGASATAAHAATRASRSYAELVRRARIEEFTA